MVALEVDARSLDRGSFGVMFSVSIRSLTRTWLQALRA